MDFGALDEIISWVISSHDELLGCESSKSAKTTAARRKRRLAGIRPRISIEELRNAFKRQASVPQDDTECVFDPMAKAQESKTIIRGRTGVVYDEAMAKHKCPWDDAYPECPDRLLSCLDRCKELQLLSRCEKLESRKATEEEIAKLHSRSVIDLLRYTQK
ncbi:histone deacetylase 6-like [Macrobrachium nipponense]|uniref:histone deacetylase 6-like n=1 Tax=Macrobrachium nipponense TaxID=159736 RepID=UPI0030C826F7